MTKCKEDFTECEEKLTEEQKMLVENNLNLMFSYAHKSRISLDEYYDVLSIGLCKAAKIFDKNKGEFSTIAYRCMENELFMCLNEEKRLSVIPDGIVLSYEELNANGNLDNQNNAVDYRSYDDMMYSTTLYEFRNKLSDKENEILEYILNGHRHSEIAKMFKCTKQNVGYHMNQIRNKAIEYFNYN